MSYFGKNIRKIRSVKTLSQQAFAELFDLKRGTLGAYEEGRSEPKIETIIKIANYFSIPIDDLLTKELTVNRLLKFKGELAIESEIEKPQALAGIPLITENNTEDYLLHGCKPAFIKDMQFIKLPLNPEKDFRGYTVNNLEMGSYDNGLFPNDIVIGERVPQEAYKKLNKGTLVFVIVEGKIILRRLFTLKENCVLRADHKNVSELTFPLNAISEMWRVRYVFYRRLPEMGSDLEQKLELLKIEIRDELKRSLN
ncbi:MAG: helix-turn-helix transcriptional regulator [Leeuwenhoekiella sp.]